jgi:hypothetical protein
MNPGSLELERSLLQQAINKIAQQALIKEKSKHYCLENTIEILDTGEVFLYINWINYKKKPPIYKRKFEIKSSYNFYKRVKELIKFHKFHWELWHLKIHTMRI